MKRHVLALSAALCATPVLVACDSDSGGGGTSVAGSYQITSYTEASGGCDNTPAAVEGMTHLVVKTGNFFGQTTVEAFVCEALDGCGAGDDAFPEWTFFERKGAAWVTTASASSFGGGSCSLSLTVQSLTATETGVHVESTNSYGTFELSEAQCEPEAAEARKAELACDRKEVLDATRL